MVTYAILGATGNIGLSLVKLLAARCYNNADSSVRINVLVRSRPKLYKLFPAAETHPNIRIFEGAVEDQGILNDCIREADVILQSAAASVNAPTCSVARNTARAVISALQANKQQTQQTSARQRSSRSRHTPFLVVISSASLSEKLWTGEGLSPWAHPVLYRALWYVYEDLRLAETYYRQQKELDNQLFHVTFVKPGGLCHDKQTGHVLSIDASKTCTSFLDLAAGMIELGDISEPQQWDGVDVSVNSILPGGANMSVSDGLWVLSSLFKGLLFTYLPFTYQWLP